MSSDISKEFATRVKELRLKYGYTQEEFSFICNVHRTYIGRIETLKRKPTLPVIEKIAKGFDMEVWELLKFTND